MKSHKKINVSFTFLLSLFFGIMVTSCTVESTADDPDTRLKVDKINVELIQTGTLSNGNKASLDVTANLGFTITSDVNWMNPDQTNYSGGRTTVTLNVDANETGDTRIGYLTIVSKERTETVKVTQTMDPDTDDGLEVDFIYLDENFDWFEVYGGQDQVQFPTQGTTIALRTSAEATKKFEEKGYADFNYGGSCFYMAKHYLKMGKNNNQTGFVVQIPNIPQGKTTNIKLTFDAAPVFNSAGTSSDKTSVVVEKLSGPGTVASASAVVSPEYSLSSITSYNQWANMEVTLYGVSAQTQIAIRSFQQGQSGYYRWYLDNVKMVKAPRGN
ncbi:MAG: BACON domain-containing protein [Dysgonomonas sp.]|nr:BACON domain-containing protein [Dysgonomonas sp.]